MSAPLPPQGRRPGSAPPLRLRSTGRREPAPSRPYADLEVIVPAYNEQARLPGTLRDLTARLARLPLRCAVTVVDNGSADTTPEIVHRWAQGPVAVHLVGCSRQGKGAAVRRGVLTSRARWVGFCDADLATSLDALGPVVDALVAGAPVVIGSRRLPDASLAVPDRVVRRLGGHGFRTVVRQMLPGVSDTQCGFKFFRGEVARELFADLSCAGFAFDVELLVRAARQGHRIVEVPVTWRAQQGSTFRVLHHGSRTVRELAEIRTSLRTTELAPLPARTRPGRVTA